MYKINIIINYIYMYKIINNEWNMFIFINTNYIKYKRYSF